MSYEYQSLVRLYNSSHFSNYQLEYNHLTSVVRCVQKIIDEFGRYFLTEMDVITDIASVIPNEFTILGLIVNTGIKRLLRSQLIELGIPWSNENTRALDVKSKFVVLDAQLDSFETIGFSTPIMIAVRNGFSDILEILLDNGANDQELYEEFYESHLSHETNINTLKIYRFFHNSDIAGHCENNERITPLERSTYIAFRIGLFDIFKLLMNSCKRIYDESNGLIIELFLREVKDDNIDLLYFFIQVGIFNKWKSLRFLMADQGNELLKQNLDKIVWYTYLSGFTGEFTDDFKEMYFLKQWPLTLMNITRIWLRNYFIHFTDGHSIYIYLNKLKIPPFLIAFLKMEDMDKPSANL